MTKWTGRWWLRRILDTVLLLVLLYVGFGVLHAYFNPGHGCANPPVCVNF
jgi:hypothetical protein